MKRSEGFTLVEILVVMALISVLMGFGIGMYMSLASMGKAGQARNTILETIQRVKNSSLESPAALVIDPVQGLVYGLEFKRVASCSFEPPTEAPAEGERLPVKGLQHKDGMVSGDGELYGYPFGHTGGGMGFAQGGSVNFGNYAEYDLTEGVQMSIWIYPTERDRAMDLITKGESYGLQIRRGSGGPVVVGYLNLVGAEDDVIAQGKGSRQEYIVADYPLSMNRWNRVAMSYDRTVVSIQIDAYGRGAVERLRETETRRIALDLNPDADLIVGGSGGTLVGRIDDFSVSGILSSEYRPVPEDVMILPRGGVAAEAKPWQIRFRGGKLDPEYHRGPESITLRYLQDDSAITINSSGNIADK